MSSEGAYGDPETRRRILQATWELLEQQGAGVKLVDVADWAGSPARPSTCTSVTGQGWWLVSTTST